MQDNNIGFSEDRQELNDAQIKSGFIPAYEDGEYTQEQYDQALYEANYYAWKDERDRELKGTVGTFYVIQ